MGKKSANLKNALRYYELNREQEKAVNDIYDNKIIVITGAAGTAKSFTSVYASMKMLVEKKISNVTLSRPMVTTEKMGFLPGTVDDKIFPYLEPLVAFFNKFGEYGEKTFESLLVAGKIKCLPLALMRGTTVADGIMILDEAQNTTPEQMLMALTRLGKNGKIIVNGDNRQKDTGLKTTGLDYAIRLSAHLPYVKHIHLTQNMRDDIVTEIIETWDRLAEKAN
jgi:phosphate starvation-inducible PhoH-like protein